MKRTMVEKNGESTPRRFVAGTPVVLFILGTTNLSHPVGGQMGSLKRATSFRMTTFKVGQEVGAPDHARSCEGTLSTLKHCLK